MKLLYPTSIILDPNRLQGFDVDIQPYAVDKTIPLEHRDADILITWINTPENLKDAAARLKKLKWIQSLAAGPNDVLSAGFDRSVVVTTGSGLHDNTVAEHTLALMLCAARRLHSLRDYQFKSEWASHLGGAQSDRPKDSFTTLRDTRILIWGYGNIAKSLAPHLTALGAQVKGIARSQRIENGIEVYSEDRLLELLPMTDVVVMILPGSSATKHALNKERLQLLPIHAWVVNVGRGTAVDEDALISAIEDREIAGAALDVFEAEPLPQASRLWKFENVIISPHAAGGRPQGSEALIVENLRRFRAQQTLKNVIQR